MRNLILLSLSLTFAACTSGKDSAADSGADSTGATDDSTGGTDDSATTPEMTVAGGWDDTCNYTLTLTNADTSVTWLFGMAETGAGTDGWYGEDGSSADSTHPASATGLALTSVHPDCGGGGIDDIKMGESTLFNESLDAGITYVLGAQDAGGASLGCWTWGHDVSYYSTCTAI